MVNGRNRFIRIFRFGLKPADMSNLLIDNHPEAVREWDYEKNAGINIATVTRGSGKVVWWKCQNGHCYEVDVKTRTRFKRWNICKLCKANANSLLSRFPEAAKEWDFQNNSEHDIHTILFASAKIVSWICDLGHQYEATPHQRTNTENGKLKSCPVCKDLDTLLVLKYPEIKEQWDFEKNVHVDINKITYGSHIVLHWICSEGHHYEQSPAVRTHGGRLNGCIVCYDESRRIHDKVLVDDLIRNKTLQTNSGMIKRTTIQIGDDSEEYIVNLLKATGLYRDVVRIGYIAGDADIVVYDNSNNMRFIQVKTLSPKLGRINGFHLNVALDYPDNMLIVGVDKTRNFYIVAQASRFEKSGISLKYGTGCSKYEDIIFSSANTPEFMRRLIDLIPFSCDETRVSEENAKEIAMLQRLEAKCKASGFAYLRNTTNANPVDGTINGYRFQAKFVSHPRKKTRIFAASTKKYAGMLDGKSIKMPYEAGDFDYLIVEVGGPRDNSTKYHNNFCIISSKDLEEHGVFITDKCSGKDALCICPPDYNKSHWSKKFWNIAPREWFVSK